MNNPFFYGVLQENVGIKRNVASFLCLMSLQVFMEIVAVNSAIYSIVLSMVICMVAVMLFTRHFLLLVVIFISITGKKWEKRPRTFKVQP